MLAFTSDTPRTGILFSTRFSSDTSAPLFSSGPFRSPDGLYVVANYINYTGAFVTLDDRILAVDGAADHGVVAVADPAGRRLNTDLVFSWLTDLHLVDANLLIPGLDDDCFNSMLQE
tara:strand:+ start:444 stop:794 length:351 start_codon:yes stop_codon:yes gene_type:complete